MKKLGTSKWLVIPLVSFVATAAHAAAQPQDVKRFEMFCIIRDGNITYFSAIGRVASRSDDGTNIEAFHQYIMRRDPTFDKRWDRNWDGNCGGDERVKATFDGAVTTERERGKKVELTDWTPSH